MAGDGGWSGGWEEEGMSGEKSQSQVCWFPLHWEGLWESLLNDHGVCGADWFGLSAGWFSALWQPALFPSGRDISLSSLPGPRTVNKGQLPTHSWAKCPHYCNLLSGYYIIMASWKTLRKVGLISHWLLLTTSDIWSNHNWMLFCEVSVNRCLDCLQWVHLFLCWCSVDVPLNVVSCQHSWGWHLESVTNCLSE